jgi:hypothetical protein
MSKQEYREWITWALQQLARAPALWSLGERRAALRSVMRSLKIFKITALCIFKELTGGK